MKKMIALILVLVLAISLAACGGSSTAASSSSGNSANSSDSTQKVKATFVGVMQGGAAWGAAESGFLAACAELGWDGQYVAPGTPNDTIAMADLMSSAVTNKCDVLIGTFYDVDVFGDVAKEAYEKGVYVASTNCALGPEYQNFWIGTDPTGMGISQAKALVEMVGDQEVCVVYMQTNATATTQNNQFAAMCEYLKDYPNISVFGQEYCDSQETLAAEKIANLVKANPQINAVVAADGNGAIGLANYVDENKNSDSFIAIGIDDDSTILNHVRSGVLDCTIAQDFYNMGYQSCMMIQDLMNGKTCDFDNDSGTVTIHADEVESYAAAKGIEIS